VVFVDDDDRISSDYIQQLLKGIESKADVVNFIVSVSLDGKPAKNCFYNKDYPNDYNEAKTYHRLPNHIMCVKRELAIKVRYKDVLRGEDSDYSKRLQPLLKTQFNIDKILYFYDYNSLETETQQKLKR